MIVRATNLYGDPRPWAVQATMTATVMDFLNVAKYPPSLLYVCATLGIVLTVTPWLDRLPVKISAFFRTIGSVPLMAYLAHLYIMHVVAILAHLVAGKSLMGQFDTIRIIFTGARGMDGTGLPLWAVYLCWAIVVAAIYPVCVYWSALKRRRKDWWLSYL